MMELICSNKIHIYKSRNLYRAFPSRSLFYFMCNDTINYFIVECNVKSQDTSNNIKGAMNNWGDKRGISFPSFGDLNSAFENSPHALYLDDGRILLNLG